MPHDHGEGRRFVPLSMKQVLRASDGVLELMPVATYICDLDGRIIQYNRRAVEIWGRAPKPGDRHDEFTQQSRFFGADGEQLPGSKLSEVLRTGQPVRDEDVVVQRPDGSRISVLTNIDPLRDRNGTPIAVVTCFQDITELKRIHATLGRAQQDLREHEQRLAATYEHAAIGIVETDASGRFLRVNEAICDITGLSRDELVGWQLLARTHPDDRDLDAEAFRKQVTGELGIYTVEKRFIRKDGRTIWIAVRSSSVRDPAGNFLYGVRVVQDITERKEAEERQKVLIDELNHRVKNTLATVQSLASQTARGATSPEAFRQAFEGRLVALSKAHDQLTLRHWKSADLKDIVSGLLAPYLASGSSQITIDGESLTIKPRAALTLAMVLHELTTNAAKYGALSSAAGKISVRWQIEGPATPHSRVLRIDWHESGGPIVSTPSRRGFGSKFIVGSVKSELEGVARMSFDAQGFRCIMEMPLAALADESRNLLPD